MTNKQAIKELIEMTNTIQLNPDTPQGVALKMAIQSLQSQDEFNHELAKRVMNQGSNEDDWSIFHNEF